MLQAQLKRSTPPPSWQSQLQRRVQRLGVQPVPRGYALRHEPESETLFLEVPRTQVFSAQAGRRALDAFEPGFLGELLRELNAACSPDLRLFLPEDAEMRADAVDDLQDWGSHQTRRPDAPTQSRLPTDREIKRLAARHGEEWLRRERLGITLLPDFTRFTRQPLSVEWQHRCQVAQDQIKALCTLPESPWTLQDDCDSSGFLRPWAVITPWDGHDRYDGVLQACQEEQDFAWSNGDFDILTLPDQGRSAQLEGALRYMKRVVHHVRTALDALGVHPRVT